MTIFVNNPTAAIVIVLANCQSFVGCLSAGSTQSMLYPILFIPVVWGWGVRGFFDIFTDSEEKG